MSYIEKINGVWWLFSSSGLKIKISEHLQSCINDLLKVIKASLEKRIPVYNYVIGEVTEKICYWFDLNEIEQ